MLIHLQTCFTWNPLEMLAGAVLKHTGINAAQSLKLKCGRELTQSQAQLLGFGMSL